MSCATETYPGCPYRVSSALHTLSSDASTVSSEANKTTSVKLFPLIIKNLASELRKRTSFNSVDVDVTVVDPYRWRISASPNDADPLQHDRRNPDADLVSPYELKAFLHRIQKYSMASPETFISALSLLDRLESNLSAGWHLTVYNCHNAVLLAIAVTSKLQDDDAISNRRYAEIGGRSLADFNRMEIALLKTMNYSLQCSSKEFRHYEHLLTDVDGPSTTANPWTLAKHDFMPRTGHGGTCGGAQRILAACD